MGKRLDADLEKIAGENRAVAWESNLAPFPGSPKVRTRLQRLLSKDLDADGDGQITRSECEEHVTKMGIPADVAKREAADLVTEGGCAVADLLAKLDPIWCAEKHWESVGRRLECAEGVRDRPPAGS